MTTYDWFKILSLLYLLLVISFSLLPHPLFPQPLTVTVFPTKFSINAPTRFIGSPLSLFRSLTNIPSLFFLTWSLLLQTRFCLCRSKFFCCNKLYCIIIEETKLSPSEAINQRSYTIQVLLRALFESFVWKTRPTKPNLILMIIQAKVLKIFSQNKTFHEFSITLQFNFIFMLIKYHIKNMRWQKIYKKYRSLVTFLLDKT